MNLQEQLLGKIKTLKLEENQEASVVDEQIESAKTILAERQKADEVEHTENTGKGKELGKDWTIQTVIDMAIEYSALLPSLPGNHWTGLATSEKVRVVWEIGLFRGNSELKNKTSFTGSIGLTTNLATGEVEIKQGSFRNDVLISYKLLNQSVIDLYDKYMQEIAKSMAKTIDAYIINADASLTGNINSDGTTFTTADKEIYYFLQGDNGLRKKALANSTALGVLDEDDYLDLSDNLWGFANKSDDVLILQQRKTQNVLNKLPTFKNASVNGTGTTVRGDAVNNVYGFDIFLTEFIPLLAKADGKVSSTPADNVNGQVVMFYTPAVQYWFGQELRLDTAVEPGKWIWLVPFFEFGFAIVDWEAETDKTVAGWLEITY